MNRSTCSDEDLMMGYQRGDITDFDVLYQRYSGRVYGFIKTRLNDIAQTDDVFQATFMKLHKSRDLYDSQYSFAAWLFTIARSTLLDHLRKTSSDRLVLDEKLLDSVSKNESESDSLGVLGQVEQKPNKSGDRWSAANLQPREQNALHMKFEQELSYDEIANRLGVSATTARQVISRAIKKLRKHFSPGEI